MEGSGNFDSENNGIIPRAMKLMFEKCDEKLKFGWKVSQCVVAEDPDVVCLLIWNIIIFSDFKLLPKLHSSKISANEKLITYLGSGFESKFQMQIPKIRSYPTPSYSEYLVYKN